MNKSIHFKQECIPVECVPLVISDSDTDDDSITSSIFGFTCQICDLRAINATQLEYKYLQDDLPSLILMVYTGANVMPVGPVGIWSAGKKVSVIKFNGTTSSIVVSKCS